MVEYCSCLIEKVSLALCPTNGTFANVESIVLHCVYHLEHTCIDLLS